VVGLSGVSFDVQAGDIYVLMGLSGSGKSTLIRLINRLVEPTAGSVVVDGEDIVRMKPADLVRWRRKRVAMVFQSFALMPHRTVFDNVAFGLEIAGEKPRKCRDKILGVLDQVGLKAYADKYPRQLSGGMQQRVGLARALAVDPDILLMDEAFSALDPLKRTEMQDLMLELQREQRRTILFVSHDLEEALKIGSRIGIMEGGQLVQEGTPHEIVTRPANDYVRRFFKGLALPDRRRPGGQHAARRRACRPVQRNQTSRTYHSARGPAHRPWAGSTRQRLRRRRTPRGLHHAQEPLGQDREYTPCQLTSCRPSWGRTRTCCRWAPW
jgi:glycine betaine/proline transport system ATP-binding protein